MAQKCARPNCDNFTSGAQAYGRVDLRLERRERELAVNIDGTICASCSNDLADWWLK